MEEDVFAWNLFISQTILWGDARKRNQYYFRPTLCSAYIFLTLWNNILERLPSLLNKNQTKLASVERYPDEKGNWITNTEMYLNLTL